MRIFKSDAHRAERGILICYKFFRKRSIPREQAIVLARSKAARLTATIATLDS